MKGIIFPEYIKNIIKRLEEAGHEAYAVGGCIRDSLLGLVPDDWDVTTSALPDETMSLFGPSAIPTGLKHGTVTVISDTVRVEVTTYRTEGKYTDHRRPDRVNFVKDIIQDLARRDFTINAMAAAPGGRFADPFGGRSDLSAGIIRCVGSPEERFNEDALRMFRALRFSAKLGFELDNSTLSALYTCAPLAEGLAVERISAEIGKMLLHPCSRQLGILLSSGLTSRFCPPTDMNTELIDALPCDLYMRISALCAMLTVRTGCDTAQLLRNARCSLSLTRCCSSAVSAALAGLPADTSGWKMLIGEIGEKASKCACAAAFVLGYGDKFSLVDDIISSGECYTLSSLAVKGTDLLALGYSGTEVGAALNELLQFVIAHPQSNDRRTLLGMLRSSRP